MYSTVDVISIFEAEAEQFILDNDRKLYLPFFIRAEKFCEENNVVIGGRIGIDLLVGRPVTKDSFVWDLYCDDTFNTSKNLTKAISEVKSPHIPARTVSLQTNIKHKEFTIYVNARTVFKIYSLDKHRGIKLVELMGPAIRTSYFIKTPIKCIPEEMQLVEIYRSLYTPARMSMWERELAAENIIYELIKDSVGEKATKEITGGATEFKFNKSSIERELLRKMIAKSDHVLIGDFALNLLKMEKSPGRLQILSSENVDKIVHAMENIITKIIKNRPAGIKLTMMRYALNIPSDFQIIKHTVYFNTGKEQIPIIDIFNSPQFEMIPWWIISDNVKIGNPWVLLRFQFIDIWVLKLILNLGTDNPDFIKGKIRSIINRANNIRKLALECLKDDPEKIFQLSNYVGSYINEMVAKKKIIKELGERFPNYYPALSQTGGSTSL